MLKDIPFISMIFMFLTAILLIVRNIYFYKLWLNRNLIEKDMVNAIFFPGVRKLMYSINLKIYRIEDPTINTIIKKVNLFSDLSLITFIMVFVSLIFLN